MSTPQQPTPNPDEPAEYRPRHAAPEASEETAPSNRDDTSGRPPVSYSLETDDAPATGRATGGRQPGGRPDVAYGGLPADTDRPDGTAPARQTWSTVAFVSAVVALLFFPIIFGVLGIGFGLYGHKKGEPLGNWSAVAALTALLAGVALRVFFFDADLIPAQN
ncbi:hypothetical protein [Nocardia sp. No.11]|uniref:hypothetical protein n=1 Tax=Nocardia sp. No.11 TaxID=3128861 RepID=UPI00319E7574